MSERKRNDFASLADQLRVAITRLNSKNIVEPAKPLKQDDRITWELIHPDRRQKAGLSGCRLQLGPGQKGYDSDRHK